MKSVLSLVVLASLCTVGLAGYIGGLGLGLAGRDAAVTVSLDNQRAAPYGGLVGAYGLGLGYGAYGLGLGHGIYGLGLAHGAYGLGLGHGVYGLGLGYGVHGLGLGKFH